MGGGGGGYRDGAGVCVWGGGGTETGADTELRIGTAVVTKRKRDRDWWGTGV